MDLTVIICTYNRCASLERTLESIRASLIPDGLEWELVVVDNNSSDGTRGTVESYGASGNCPVVYLAEPQQGLSHARNRGIAEAKGGVIAFTDDDVVVDPHWIANLVKGFRQYDVRCIGGKILPLWGKPKPKWLSESRYVSLALLDYGEAPIYLQKAALWGANLAVEAELFNRYGLFDPNRGRTPQRLYGDEESHFLTRVLEGGEKILYLPDAVVHHFIPEERMTMRYFRKWSFDQGELHGTLIEDDLAGNSVDLAAFALRGLSVSALSFLKSFLPNRDHLGYQAGAAYRLGYTKGRIRRRK